MVSWGFRSALQNAAGFFGEGVTVDGPGTGAGSAANCPVFAASAFALKQAGIPEIDEKFVLPVHVA